MARIVQISYIFIFLTLILLGTLGLATPFLTVLFSLLALRSLAFFDKKWIAIVLFIILVSVIFYGFIFFLKQALTALPNIVGTSIPAFVEFAKAHGWDLPFSDISSLKDYALQGVQDQLDYLANFAKIATKEFVFLIIGIVVAVSLFKNAELDLDRGHYAIKDNLYTLVSEEIAKRFAILYQSFATVMGAQIIISVINSIFTAVFVFTTHLPNAVVIVVLTFICGLLPIVGNLVSNAIIVGISLTISPKLAVTALVFLVVIHKLEYFLNSKIIGGRIKNPMWLTLLALVLGERLMGIPGMILAPVVLNYLKLEGSQTPVEVTS